MLVLGQELTFRTSSTEYPRISHGRGFNRCRPQVHRRQRCRVCDQWEDPIASRLCDQPFVVDPPGRIEPRGLVANVPRLGTGVTTPILTERLGRAFLDLGCEEPLDVAVAENGVGSLRHDQRRMSLSGGEDRKKVALINNIGNIAETPYTYTFLQGGNFIFLLS